MVSGKKTSGTRRSIGAPDGRGREDTAIPSPTRCTLVLLSLHASLPPFTKRYSLQYGTAYLYYNILTEFLGNTDYCVGTVNKIKAQVPKQVRQQN